MEEKLKVSIQTWNDGEWTEEDCVVGKGNFDKIVEAVRHNLHSLEEEI